jgi:hypothetical protein
MKFVATKTADQLDLQALPSIAESNCADNFHGRG